MCTCVIECVSESEIFAVDAMKPFQALMIQANKMLFVCLLSVCVYEFCLFLSIRLYFTIAFFLSLYVKTFSPVLC